MSLEDSYKSFNVANIRTGIVDSSGNSFLLKAYKKPYLKRSANLFKVVRGLIGELLGIKVVYFVPFLARGAYLRDK